MKNILLSAISLLLLYSIINIYNIDITKFELFKLEIFLIVSFFTLNLILLNSIRLFYISKNILKNNFQDYLFFSLISFVFNILSFSGTGEILKYYLLSKRLKKKDKVFSFFFIERFYGLTSMLTLTLCLILFYIFNLSILVFFVFFVSFLLIKLLKNNLYIKSLPYLNYFEFSLSEILKETNKFLLLIISFLIHIIYIIQLLIIIYFVYEIKSDLIVTIILVMTVLAFNSFPITYSGFGAREFSVVVVGSFFTLDQFGFINSIFAVGIYTYLLAAIIFLFLFIFLRVYYKIDLWRSLSSKNIILVTMK